MSGLETASMVALWLGFLVLAGLLLLLYRQVDRAYEGGGATNRSLLVGVAAPDVEILDGETIRPLEFPAVHEFMLLGFVSTTCAACAQLIDAVGEVAFPGRRVVLVNGEGASEWLDKPAVDVSWLAHPPDVIRSYGVNTVPMLYVLRGRTVLGSAVTADAAGVSKLISEAMARAEELSPNGRAAVDVVSAGQPG